MIRNPANALRRLFDAKKRDMDLEELDWFSSMTDAAILHADNVADTLNALAMTISGGSSSAPADDQLVNILFMLASQSETVSALAYIGSEAEAIAGELKGQSTGQ